MKESKLPSSVYISAASRIVFKSGFLRENMGIFNSKEIPQTIPIWIRFDLLGRIQTSVEERQSYEMEFSFSSTEKEGFKKYILKPSFSSDSYFPVSYRVGDNFFERDKFHSKNSRIDFELVSLDTTSSSEIFFKMKETARSLAGISSKNLVEPALESVPLSEPTVAAYEVIRPLRQPEGKSFLQEDASTMWSTPSILALNAKDIQIPIVPSPQFDKVFDELNKESLIPTLEVPENLVNPEDSTNVLIKSFRQNREMVEQYEKGMEENSAYLIQEIASEYEISEEEVSNIIKENDKSLLTFLLNYKHNSGSRFQIRIESSKHFQGVLEDSELADANLQLMAEVFNYEDWTLEKIRVAIPTK